MHERLELIGEGLVDRIQTDVGWSAAPSIQVTLYKKPDGSFVVSKEDGQLEPAEKFCRAWLCRHIGCHAIDAFIKGI